MTELRIAVKDDRTSFTPGATLEGRASWRAEVRPESAELRLFWYTQGKGTQDVQVVDTVPFDDPQSIDERPFHLVLPKEPYSFSGKLISLIWAIELVIESGLVERREFVMSPSGREIDISHDRA